MVEPEDVHSDALTALVWTLRIVLPCVLFWISFGPRLRWPWRFNQHSRETMLEHWRIVKIANEPVPKVMANLMMVDAQTAPMLFTDSAARRQKSERNEKSERPERERGERGDRSRGQERRERKQPSLDPLPQESPQAKEQDSVAMQHITEELMYWESLVNFVAFGRHEQQRFFLVTNQCIPPPPPRVQKTPNPSDPEAAALLAIAIERANAEAQMVLRGAIQAGPVGFGASQALYTQMVDHDIEIMPDTFELVIESCIAANELQQASDYLMRMEASGQTPSNDLLDRVMDLYLQHKRKESDGKPKMKDALPTALPAGLVLPMVSDVGSGHQLDVAGLKRLVAPPPPPPPPVRPTPGSVPVYPGHGVDEYNHMINHSMPIEIPSLLLPWQSRLPYRNVNRDNQALYKPRNTDESRHLPAFCIPDEFVVKRDVDEVGVEKVSEVTVEVAGKDARTDNGNEVVLSKSLDDPTMSSSDPIVEGVKADLSELVSGSVLSADAVEFVMPQLPQSEALAEPLQYIARTGNQSLDVNYSSASENWQFMQQDPNVVASGWTGDPSMTSDLYGTIGTTGRSFEWSVQAPVFTPMASRSLPESDRVAFKWGNTHQEPSHFVHGHMPMQSPLPVGPISLGTDEFNRPEDELQIDDDGLVY